MGRTPTRRRTAARLDVAALESRDCPAISVRVDYRFDATQFFNDPARRAALQRAVDAIVPRLQDTLTAISPSAGNGWTLTIANPVTGGIETLPNPTIATNEIVLFVMGAELPGSTLGRSLDWSYSATGSAEWLATVKARGQAGATAATPTDVGPWGGAVAFDSGTNWNFTTAMPAGGQFDFRSVAEHELLHVLGFESNNPSFARYAPPTGHFNGPHAVAVFGQPVPITPGDDGELDHWAQSTTFSGQTPAMVPILPAGSRQLATALDFAALRDVGWEVSSPPAPPIPPATPPAAPPATPPATPPTLPPALPPTPSSPPTSPPASPGRVVAGVGFLVHGQAVLGGLTATGKLLFTVPAETGGDGVAVASADFNGDGTPDWAVGSGPGVETLVRILDGRTLAEIASIRPFEARFTGGVNLSAGDLTRDGRPELVVTPDDGGGPRVRVFDPAAGYASVADFFGIEDVAFRGGARAAVGDVNGDGAGDLLVAAGLRGGPRVAGFSGRTILSATRQKLFPDFFAADPALRDGVHLAAGDFNGDTYADVLVGAIGAGPAVSVLNGRDLTKGNSVEMARLPSGPVGPRSGPKVAVADGDGDGRADAVTAAEGGGRVVIYRGRDFATLLDVALFPAEWVPVAVG